MATSRGIRATTYFCISEVALWVTQIVICRVTVDIHLQTDKVEIRHYTHGNRVTGDSDYIPFKISNGYNHI